MNTENLLRPVLLISIGLLSALTVMESARMLPADGNPRGAGSAIHQDTDQSDEYVSFIPDVF